MSITGKIKTLFADKNKSEAIFPRTKISAVSDDAGNGLDAILANMSTGGGGIPAAHTHSTSDLTSGTLSIARGGTGATTLPDLLKVLCSNGTGNSSPGYVLGFNTDYKSGGYTSMANLRTALGIKDYVTEQGTSGIWTYRKWNSGFAECWGEHNCGTVSMTKAWGSLYESTSTYRATFPSGLFSAAPTYVSIEPSHNSSASFIERGNDAPTTTTTDAFYFVRPSSGTGSSMKVYVYANGKWK